MSSDALVRESLQIERTHRRFLLKELSFTQQFAGMYFVRLAFLKERSMQEHFAQEEGSTKGNPAIHGAKMSRILDLPIGQRAACFGTIFKQVANLRRFLDEYQKELVRIDAGGDDDDDGEGGDAGEGMEMEDSSNKQEVTSTAMQLSRQATDRSLGIGSRPTCLCSEKDVLILEDDSGRVELNSDKLHQFTTGVVCVIVGELNEKGVFIAEDILPCGAAPQLSHPLLHGLQTQKHTPRYIAVVSGLNIDAHGKSAGASIDLLVDYLCGNLGDEETQQQSARISKLIVAGNSIDITDEWKLKGKVKLDPQDHAKEPQSVNTIANCMRQLDQVLAQLADCIEIDIMPGDTDASNSFFPQQPVHPLLLKTTAKKSTTRLVTNPYEFRVKSPAAADKNDESLLTFVTSGQNVDDVLRQVDTTAIDVMKLMIDSSCSCPTAPNSLVCYPFDKHDPFVFQSTPHLYIAGNQEAFETVLHESQSGTKTRIITVPSFNCKPELVLIDINSPTLETTSVKFV